MVDLEIEGIAYRSNAKLNAVDQFLLSKRLIPILDVLARVARSGVEADDMVILIAEGVAKLSDEDALYILDKTLTGMQCQRDGVWAQVWNHQAKQPQFQDMSMTTMLQLTFAVLTDTLGSFMPAPAGTSAATNPRLNAR
jgi:hypothetical protein